MSTSTVTQETLQVKVPKGTRDLNPYQMAVRRDVINKVTACFERHGAETLDTPVFELKEILTGKYGEDSKLIYDLQDQGGELLALRYDLTVPFARYMAMNGLKKMKRYHIGKVYRRDNPAVTMGRFREFTQCDYDIAGPSEGMLADAEILCVLRECLDSLALGVDYVIKVNHRGILDSILEISGVPSDLVRTISSAIDKLDKSSWPKVKEEIIEKGVSGEVADKIGRYVVIRGTPKEVIATLQADTALAADARASAALRDMTQLVDALDAFGVACVSFDLGLARGLDYYTGMIFEVVLKEQPKANETKAENKTENENKNENKNENINENKNVTTTANKTENENNKSERGNEKQRDRKRDRKREKEIEKEKEKEALLKEKEIDVGAIGSIAAGGRYDNLINMFGGESVPVVGLSLGIERIFALVENKYRKNSKIRSTATQVLVAIVGGEARVLQERLRVCAALWNASIACEFVPTLQPKLRAQLDYANSRGIPFVIIIGMSELEKETVVLRNMTNAQQNTISLKSLMAELTPLLA